MEMTTVAIIGGGASGCLVAIQLLRNSIRPLKIVVIEPQAALGAGVAYSTDHPALRLNVNTARMSCFPDDPDHFLRWMQRVIDPECRPDSFALRLCYRQYLQDVLAEAAEKSVSHVEHIQDMAEQ